MYRYQVQSPYNFPLAFFGEPLSAEIGVTLSTAQLRLSVTRASPRAIRLLPLVPTSSPPGGATLSPRTNSTRLQTNGGISWTPTNVPLWLAMAATEAETSSATPKMYAIRRPSMAHFLFQASKATVRVNAYEAISRGEPGVTAVVRRSAW